MAASQTDNSSVIWQGRVDGAPAGKMDGLYVGPWVQALCDVLPVWAPPIDGDVHIDLVFDLSAERDRRRHSNDLANLAKLVLNELAGRGLYRDPSQVTELTVTRHQAYREGVTIIIRRATTSAWDSG